MDHDKYKLPIHEQFLFSSYYFNVIVLPVFKFTILINHYLKFRLSSISFSFDGNFSGIKEKAISLSSINFIYPFSCHFNKMGLILS